MKNKLLFVLLILFFFSAPFLEAKNKVDPLEQVNLIVRKQIGEELITPPTASDSNKNFRGQLTLDQAIQQAIEHNPSMKESLQEVLISQGEARQAGLPENPQAEAGVEFAERDSGEGLPHYAVNQNILDFYLAVLRKRAATSRLEETKLKTANELVAFVSQVKKAYYSVQALEQLQAQLHQILSSTRTAADLSQRQLEAGNINALELNAQKLIAEQTQIEWIRSNADLKIAKTRLAELLGRSDLEFSVQKQLPWLPKSDPGYTLLEKIALENRLDLAAIRQKSKTLNHNYDLAKWEGFPQLSAGVASETDIEGGTRTGPDFGLQIPLFNRGQGSKEKVKAQIKQNQYSISAMENRIRQEIKESLARLSEARRMAIQYQNQILPLITKTREEALLQYNYMLKGPFDLLQLRREELKSRREYLEAVQNYWIERAHLEQVVGGSLHPQEKNR